MLTQRFSVAGIVLPDTWTTVSRYPYAPVGVEVGAANTESTKAELIAELDALVSLLYGLTVAQVEHVFATFHRGWNYAARLERVLAYYEQWKDAT